MEKQVKWSIWIILGTVLAVLLGIIPQARSQQKELPEVTIATAVPNFAFAALWVAEQLKFFEQEGVRAKITVAGGGSQCQTGAVGRSINFCASSSEGLVLAHAEGAPLIAIQAHNRNLTMSVGVRKEIADKLKVTRSSPLEARIKGFIATGHHRCNEPGSGIRASYQISWLRRARAIRPS